MPILALFGAVALLLCPLEAGAGLEEGGKDPGLASFGMGLHSRSEREIERIVSSPLRRLPSNARSRGWAELGFHARAGDGPGRLMASPLGAAYYRLAEPLYVTLMMGAFGELVLEGDDAFSVEAHIGNPYLGFGFELPLPGVELQLLGGFTVPLAGVDGAAAYHFAQGMRGLWSPWLWASRRLSPVVGARIDTSGDEAVRFGGEFGLAPMFWFGEGRAPAQLAIQGSLHASVVVADVVDIGARGLGVGLGEGVGTQLSTEIFVNVQTGGDRIYHARLTMPLNKPYGFAFAPEGVWAIHVGGGMLF